MIEPEELMRLAIAKAREGVRAGQSPFGCAIANDQGVVAAAHNTVIATTDITAHAEVNALRAACQKTQAIFLTGCLVATTCEPCPMCMSALHWARVETVHYGATISDAESAGFNELRLPAAELLRSGGSSVSLIGETLHDECRTLFTEWSQSANRTVY